MYTNLRVCVCDFISVNICGCIYIESNMEVFGHVQSPFHSQQSFDRYNLSTREHLLKVDNTLESSASKDSVIFR